MRIKDTVLLTNKDDHLVPVLTLQLPSPAERALTIEQTVSQDSGRLVSGRLITRFVRRSGRDDTGKMDGNGIGGLGRFCDLAGVCRHNPIDGAVNLMIRHSVRSAGLSFVPQAIGGRRGDHRHHESQQACLLYH